MREKDWNFISRVIRISSRSFEYLWEAYQYVEVERLLSRNIKDDWFKQLSIKDRSKIPLLTETSHSRLQWSKTSTTIWMSKGKVRAIYWSDRQTWYDPSKQWLWGRHLVWINHHWMLS